MSLLVILMKIILSGMIKKMIQAILLKILPWFKIIRISFIMLPKHREFAISWRSIQEKAN